MIVPIPCKPDRNANCKITSHKSANGITDYKVIAEINGTTLLTSATQYAQRPKHYLTTKAERLSWDIFSQEWDNFSEYPAGTVPSLVAQLIGINPDFSDTNWISCYALPMFKDAGDAETCKLLNEFIRRVDVTLANIATGELKPIGDVVSDGLVIRRIDFVTFAERVRWLQEPDQQTEPEQVAGAGKISKKYETYRSSLDKLSESVDFKALQVVDIFKQVKITDKTLWSIGYATFQRDVWPSYKGERKLGKQPGRKKK